MDLSKKYLESLLCEENIRKRWTLRDAKNFIDEINTLRHTLRYKGDETLVTVNNVKNHKEFFEEFTIVFRLLKNISESDLDEFCLMPKYNDHDAEIYIGSQIIKIQVACAINGYQEKAYWECIDKEISFNPFLPLEIKGSKFKNREIKGHEEIQAIDIRPVLQDKLDFLYSTAKKKIEIPYEEDVDFLFGFDDIIPLDNFDKAIISEFFNNHICSLFPQGRSIYLVGYHIGRIFLSGKGSQPLNHSTASSAA